MIDAIQANVYQEYRIDAHIEPVYSENAPKAIGPYSQAVCAGPFVFVSGQIGIDPATAKLGGTTIEEQTWQALRNIEAILAEVGLTLENVVDVVVYLKDLQDFPIMNRVYAEKFSYQIKPPRATVQVSKLPMDALIEISCKALLPEAS